MTEEVLKFAHKQVCEKVDLAPLYRCCFQVPKFQVNYREDGDYTLSKIFLFCRDCGRSTHGLHESGQLNEHLIKDWNEGCERQMDVLSW